MSTFFTFGATTVLKAVACRRWNDRVSILVEDPSISCFTEEHFGIFGIALPMIGVNICLPICFVAYILWYGKKKGILQDKAFCARYGFLLERYEHEFCWWELVVFARKAATAVIVVLLHDEINLQVMLLGAVYAFVACLTVHLRPFKQERHNVLEGVLHCALVIMIFLIFINPTDILLLSQFSEPRESFLVFLQIGMLLLMVSACTRTIRNEMISSQISLPSFYGICEDKTTNCEGYSRDKSQQLGGLEERRYLIGRQSYCDIRVQAPTVSREHAQIQVDDNDHVWLVNLSQNNPVKVNGMEHLSRVRLSNGDQFTIGDTRRKAVKPQQKQREEQKAR